ncbi:winged helix-turn-helix transcriptional regulator [Amycolatopsis alkalitolerans]|uniref:Winged helix-turn-helix transcriptional regulator n=1 Tax=Amycolatopsis alkalitolerans TaxID=2547244 RepID=A0A5C4LSH7_9PSEU|nr:winged helix-turn-helix transcriptional regulator [Amycolatopsis alkalitolerans]
MDFEADNDPTRYRYEVIAERLAELITSGQIRPKTPLPAEGSLAELCGVSLGTARHAMQLLRERGLAVTLRSKGTYVMRSTDRIGSR